jgi:hypothetical protein
MGIFVEKQEIKSRNLDWLAVVWAHKNERSKVSSLRSFAPTRADCISGMNRKTLPLIGTHGRPHQAQM